MTPKTSIHLLPAQSLETPKTSHHIKPKKVEYAPVAQKKIPKPAWYKNTYFWISGILFILCIVGLMGGDIRDPGQKREGMLWLLYLVASGIMLINGLMSHSQTVQHYQETVDSSQQTSTGTTEGTKEE